MTNETEIQFINHASLLVRCGSVSLLSDPEHPGDAFHKGWSLIHELQDEEIYTLLSDVSHIWISHEHPDHFSISFSRSLAISSEIGQSKYSFNRREIKGSSLF